MADRWFRLPETGTGTFDDPLQPDFKGHNVSGFSGNTAHPDGAPHWVVRVYADTAVLDSLANEAGVVELSGVPTQALNQIFGQNRDASGWEDGFSVGGN